MTTPSLAASTLAAAADAAPALANAQRAGADALLAKASLESSVAALSAENNRLKQQLADQPAPAPAPAPAAPTSARAVPLADLIYLSHGAPARRDGKKATDGTPFAAHEGLPGVANTAWDWYLGAKTNVDAGFPVRRTEGDYDHHNIWWECIPIEGGMPAAHRDARVQFSAYTVLHLRRGAWVNLTRPRAMEQINGGYWTGGPNYLKTAGVTPRKEAIGWSIPLAPTTNIDGSPKNDTAILHYFDPANASRIPIEAGSQLCILGWMRSITDNPAVDLGRARYTACLSGDLFLDAASNIGPSGYKNTGLGKPRAKILTPEWRLHGWISGTPTQMAGYPPVPLPALR